MSDLLWLNGELGGRTLAAFLYAAEEDLVRQDGLAPTVARELVLQRADAGDPLVLAACGQVWVRRDDVDVDEAPVRRLFICERLAAPPRVHVEYLDGEATGHTDDLHLEVLDLYRLESWRPPEVLLTHWQQGA